MDPHLDESSPHTSTRDGVQFDYVSSGRAALRKALCERFDLWAIRAELADLSGADLCRMLKSRDSVARVCIVASNYSIDLEREAYAARATTFVVQSTDDCGLEELVRQAVPGGLPLPLNGARA